MEDKLVPKFVCVSADLQGQYFKKNSLAGLLTNDGEWVNAPIRGTYRDHNPKHSFKNRLKFKLFYLFKGFKQYNDIYRLYEQNRYRK